MSAYVVHKLCRRILHDRNYRVRVKIDPEKALDEFPFDADERTALLAGDVGWLYRHGAFAFMLLILSRFEVFGLALPVFNARMRALDDHLTRKLGGENGKL
jgi:hypothetical protein